LSCVLLGRSSDMGEWIRRELISYRSKGVNE
jgi:hypothetical protein